MDVVSIIELITKAITIAEALIEAGQTAAPAFKAIADLASGAQNEDITDEQLQTTEDVLDGLVSQFNLEME